MRVPRTGRLLAVAGALGALAVGCGDSGDSGNSGATPTASSTTSATSTPTPSSDPTPTESSSAPTVAPADGPPIRLKSLTGAFPADFEVVGRTLGSNSAGDTDLLTDCFIFVADVVNVGSTDFDDIVANVLVNYESQDIKPVRGENRVVDGVEGWVLEGTRKRGMVYEFGTVIGGQHVQFTFSSLKAPKDFTEIVESVLASVQWRSS